MRIPRLSGNDEKIESQNALVTATLAWKSFFKVVETSDGFLFYPVKNIFYWLPFSAFESSECVAKVRQLIADNGYLKPSGILSRSGVAKS